MTKADSYRLKSPSHPGKFIRSEILEPMKLSITDAAAAIGVTRAALSSFVNGRSALSADMALRLEKAFGLSLETLMRMQNSYDIALARQREDSITVERYRAIGA